jgi:hypothetical protein
VCCFVVCWAACCWGRLALAGQIEHLKVSLENKCSSQLSVVLGLYLGFVWCLQVRAAGKEGLVARSRCNVGVGWGPGPLGWRGRTERARLVTVDCYCAFVEVCLLVYACGMISGSARTHESRHEGA